jgi:phospholipase/lecithinase/hemolysin
MRHTKLALAVMASAILAACGSGSPSAGDQTLKVKFASQVSFGDSLSDVGSYKVGTVAALGGGKFTINGNNSAAAPALTGKIWIELLAAQFGLPAPCAAQTGLDGNAAKGFSVPVQNHTGCYAYGQGGSRVTNPVGEGHKLTGSEVGALTVPVVTQVKNHLAAVGGKFKGDEIVFVWSAWAGCRPRPPLPAPPLATPLLPTAWLPSWRPAPPIRKPLLPPSASRWPRKTPSPPRPKPRW